MVSFVITPSVQSTLEGGDLRFTISVQNPNYAAAGGSYGIYWRTNATSSHAASGSDYDDYSQLQYLVFSPSHQSYSISIPTYTDTNIEGDEYFTVDLYDFQRNWLGVATTFTIHDAVPDLAIGDLYVDPTVVAGDKVSISFSIVNSGTSSATATTARLYLSTNDSYLDPNDQPIGSSFSIPTLTAGAVSAVMHASLDIPASMAKGTYSIIVVADVNNVVTNETSEANNSAHQTFTVTKPDLAIYSLDVGSTVAAGDSEAISFRIINSGTAAAPATSARLYLSTNGLYLDPSDQPIGDPIPITALSAQGISAVMKASTLIPANMAPGTYSIIVVIDSGNVVTNEISEDNNSLHQTFFVTEPSSSQVNWYRPYKDSNPNRPTVEDIKAAALQYQGYRWGPENCTGLVWAIAKDVAGPFYDLTHSVVNSMVLDLPDGYTTPHNTVVDAATGAHWHTIESDHWQQDVREGDIVRIPENTMPTYPKGHSFVVMKKDSDQHWLVIDNTDPQHVLHDMNPIVIKEHTFNNDNGFEREVLGARTAYISRLNSDAAFTGSAGQYSVANSGGGVTITDNVSGRDGAVTLDHVSQLQFSDVTLVFDLVSAADQLVYKIYQAAFGRTPDNSGFRYWAVSADAQHLSALQVADLFIASPEFAAKYGSNPSNSDYITALYHNVFQRAPDQAGLNYWVGNLVHGEARDQLLVDFAISAEMQTLVGSHMTNGYWTT